MLDEPLREWETEKLVKVVPATIAIAFILIIAIVFRGNSGMIGISILFAIIFAMIPYTAYNYYQVRRIKAMEEQLPNFLRDLVENKKSGMTLPQALEDTSKNEYGKLTPEVQKMANQISWDISFSEVLEKFSERTQDSELIQRTLRIIMEARRSGGDVVSTMETIASDASTLVEMERERKSKMTQHSVVMYMIYLMYLAITIILSKILIPMTQMEGLQAGATELMGMGGGGKICGAAAASPAKAFICSFFISLSKTFGMGTGTEGYYMGLFLSMILIQGIFTGLVIGQIKNNAASTGMKHSMILTGIGFAAFILTLKYFSLGLI